MLTGHNTKIVTGTACLVEADPAFVLMTHPSRNRVAYWARLGASVAAINQHLQQQDWERNRPVQLSENTVTPERMRDALR